jgi:IS5 family transposase
MNRLRLRHEKRIPGADGRNHSMERVDGDHLAAPPSTKNCEQKRDPDACQTKKGNTWHFGYKAHIGVDQDTGLVQHLEVTAANVHDLTVTSRLLTGNEKMVCGDFGYLGASKREDAITHNNEGKKICYKINRIPSQSKSNSVRSQGEIKRRERENFSIRKGGACFRCRKGTFWLP